MFETIESRGVDQLLALMATIREDQRPDKVDLVLGVYKDESGQVPIMRAVKEAEAQILRDEATKTYVGISGDAAFRDFVPPLLLGTDAKQLAEGRVTALQTVGGTGALRVACDLLNAMKPGNRIWVSTPTWANHEPIAVSAGLTPARHPYFRASDRGLDFEGMMAHLDREAVAGDAILLHACCHNPTGVDLSRDQWRIVTDFVVERGLFPLVDCAYQGFGDGLEEDAAGLRIMAAAVPEMLLASSFSKNFGIYAERTGALTLIGRTAEDVTRAHGAAETLIRANYSMPPCHGARIVAGVFASDELTQMWREELEEIRLRIAEIRKSLRDKLEGRQVSADLSFLTDQRGMFSYTGFTPEMVARLREEFGIYTAGDGRINVAGASAETIDAVAEGFAAILR